MSILKVLSLNVRGLNNKIKRRMLFKTFQDYDIVSLQETYVNDKNLLHWKQDWPGDFCHINGTTNSLGLITLINKQFQYDNLEEIKINNRCLGISFIHNDKHVVIFNIYAPSVKDERVDFLENLPDLATFYNPNSLVILNGDFNMTVDNKSNISGLPHSNKEIICFNQFINKYSLFDTWKINHPNEEDYSWIRFINRPNSQTQYVARRLDYLFCNDNLKELLTFSEMQHFSSTDHKAIISFFKMDNFPRGKGLWQLNEELLDDNEFIQHMSQFIKDHYLSLKEENEYSNTIIWDLIKIAIRDESMAFSKEKKMSSFLEENMNERIAFLNKELSNEPSNLILAKKLFEATKKKEITDLSLARGALKRSRAKDIDENEKCSAYFLGLEKTRQAKRIVKSIYDENRRLVTSPNQILPVIADFYENLMNEKDPATVTHKKQLLDTFLGESTHPTLDDDDISALEAPITILEIKEALKQLNSDSAPGCDGLTPNFYTCFWDSVKTPLFASLTESIQNNTLSVSQRRAVITLLPKSNEAEALRDISQWRPISLLTTDYKLFSKVLAMRLQTVIHKLINENQVGYIKGRNINDHIRLIDDMISYANTNNLPGMLVSLDYRKAFDTVSRQAIMAALSKFNFGPTFSQYVSTILNGTEATIKNAGWCSKWFATNRGVRQGCNLSPLLFILVVELLAIKIRSNPNIEGILDNTNDCFDKETKLSQFADDASLYLKTILSLKHTLNEIDTFSEISGLYLNRNKSIATWLGSDKDNLPGGEGLKWLSPTEYIKILGIYFNSTIEASQIEKNWEIKIEEVKNVIHNWSKRNCSLFGKSIVAKTFLLSKINYIIQSLNLPINIQKEIDNLIFKFLWKTNTNKTGVEKIKRTTLCLDTNQGGISMISIEIQQKVMLLKWLHKLNLKQETTHFKIVNEMFKPLGGLTYLINCSTNLTNFKGLDKIDSQYWQHTIKAWLDIDKSAIGVNNEQCINIFNNNLILYKNKPIYIMRWLNKGIKFAHQMFVDDRIKSFTEVQLEIGPYGRLIFDYFTVRNAIEQSTDRDDLTNRDHNSSDAPSFFHFSNKYLRKVIAQNTNKPNCIDVWQRKIDTNVTKYFSSAIYATKETQLRALQFKITHNIYPCNALLFRMKIKPSSQCDECQELEFLDHMFYSCPKLKPFWELIEHKLTQIIGHTMKINVVQALFGLLKHDTNATRSKINEANHLILVAKLCITKNRLIKPGALFYIFESEVLLRSKYFPSLKIET